MRSRLDMFDSELVSEVKRYIEEEKQKPEWERMSRAKLRAKLKKKLKLPSLPDRVTLTNLVE